MFLFYKISGLKVNLINTCDTFEPLYNVARQRVMDVLDPESKKEYTERFRTIGEKSTKIDYGRHSMLINIEAKEFKYETKGYCLHVKQLPSRLKDEELILFDVINELKVHDFSNDFNKLYEEAVNMTLKDLEEFSDEENHKDYEQFFLDSRGKEVFEEVLDKDSYDDGVYVNFKKKYFEYWSSESEAYTIIINKLPKRYRRVIL